MSSLVMRLTCTANLTQWRMIMAVDLKGASDALTQKSQLDQLEQAQKNAENKKQAEALKGFQQALQQL